jgi:orotidine-5'-phosphate decarboxylase
MPVSNPICVALDMPDLTAATTLARALKPHAGYMKLGLEFFYAHGAKGYEKVAAEGLPIFLDLKLHDIPNTVAQGLTSLMRLSPKPAITNIHASGGPDMMKSAADAVHGQCKLIAVTVLTSLSNADVWAMGFDSKLETQALATSMALEAMKAGLDGVVCSPHDASAIKRAAGAEFLAVVPGIRPAGTGAQDQKRIATPREAMKNGADILVIGRAITAAADPARACADIKADLDAG